MHTAIKKLISILCRQRRPNPAIMMARRSTPVKSGFTLAEVVVAATLLGIALVPIIKAMAQINTYSVILERRTQSLCLARTKLNKIQAESIYNFDSIPSQSTEVLGSYIRSTTSEMVAGSNNNLKTIIVSVGTSGGPARAESAITLQTRVARRW